MLYVMQIKTMSICCSLSLCSNFNSIKIQRGTVIWEANSYVDMHCVARVVPQNKKNLNFEFFWTFTFIAEWTYQDGKFEFAYIFNAQIIIWSVHPGTYSGNLWKLWVNGARGANLVHDIMCLHFSNGEVFLLYFNEAGSRQLENSFHAIANVLKLLRRVRAFRRTRSELSKRFSDSWNLMIGDSHDERGSESW